MNSLVNSDVTVFDPADAAKSIGESYLRYLTTRYKPADAALSKEVHRALQERFEREKGPFQQSPLRR